MKPSLRNLFMKKLTRDTTLACITRGRSGFDIRTFECPECDHVHQSAQAALASEWELALAGNKARKAMRPQRNLAAFFHASLNVDVAPHAATVVDFSCVELS
jgi:hypothetical protein